MMQLETFEQTHSRLTGSIIMMGDRPIYVHKVDEVALKDKVAQIHYVDLRTYRRAKQNVSTLYYPSHHINLNPVPLGLVNYKREGVVVQVTRSPVRMWKAGLTSRNARAYLVSTGNQMMPNSVIFSSDMADAICNRYPSFQDALENKLKYDGGLAFCREFATDGRYLYYKNRGHVGILKGDVPVLYEDYNYLQELLDRRLQYAG